MVRCRDKDILSADYTLFSLVNKPEGGKRWKFQKISGRNVCKWLPAGPSAHPAPEGNAFFIMVCDRPS
jgi:hypothetical protein